MIINNGNTSYFQLNYSIWHVFHLDINECTMPGSCHSNATCINLDGSHNCSCIMGTTGNGFTSCEGTESRIIFQHYAIISCT